MNPKVKVEFNKYLDFTMAMIAARQQQSQSIRGITMKETNTRTLKSGYFSHNQNYSHSVKTIVDVEHLAIALMDLIKC